MIEQFKNLSSWRRNELTIEPHEVGTFSFLQTTPNVFVITNSNNARLKVGISHLPRADKYEFKVEQNCTETVGTPNGTKYLYVLNDSSVQVNVIVFSIETTFDPQILKNLNVALEGAELTTNTELTGVAKDIVLPVKDNLIYDLLLDMIDGKNLSTLNQNLTEMNTKLGANDGGKILEKLDLLISKKVSLDGSGITLNGVQTDLSTVHSYLTDVKNLLSAMDNKQSDQILNLIKTAVQTSAGNTNTLKSSVDTLSGWVNKLYNQTVKGQLFTKKVTPAVSTNVTISPGSGLKFSKVYYIRAVSGDFSIYLAGQQSDTVNNLPALTLNEGESMNDLETDIFNIIVNSSDSGAVLEIVGETKEV